MSGPPALLPTFPPSPPAYREETRGDATFPLQSESLKIMAPQKRGWSGWSKKASEAAAEMGDSKGRVRKMGLEAKRPLWWPVGSGWAGEAEWVLPSSDHGGGWASHTLRPWPG